MTGENGWVDISVPLRSGMVHWPNNPPVRIERMLNMGRGDVAKVSTISFGSHTGTHMDAPVHFVRGREGMDRMPLGATMGRARVIEIQDPVSVKPDELYRTGSRAASASSSRRGTRPGAGGRTALSNISSTSRRRRPATSRLAAS